MITTYIYHPGKGLRISDRVPFQRWEEKSKEILWIDLFNPSDEEAITLLEHRFKFHPLAIEDAKPKEREPGAETSHHPKVDDYQKYLFLIFNGVMDSKADSSEVIDALQISAFLGENYLVTIHYEPSPSIAAWQQKCEQTPKVFERGPDYIMHLILDEMIDHYSPVLDTLESEIDGVEGEIFTRPQNETLTKILNLKRKISKLRRIAVNQKEVLFRLSRGEFALVSQEESFYYRNVYDHLVRISDLAESYRDLVTGLLDAYLSVVSNRLNEIMKFLTMVGTIILPLTLITGIYGMNFEFMPELHWRYGYMMVWLFMGTIFGALVWYFRRKRWM